MNFITKLPYIVASLAMVGSTAAFADDPQLQARLARERAQLPDTDRSVTIGAYVDHRGLDQRYVEQRDVERREEARDLRFELRDTGHGQLRGVYVSDR